MSPDQQIRNLQERLWGSRYAGASLSTITNLPGGVLETIAEWIKKPAGFLTLVGNPGCGKTYFCSAILENLPKQIRWVRGYKERDLLTRLRESISDTGKGDYVRHLQMLADDDLIIIDDLGSTGVTDWRKEVIFEFIDFRYSIKKPTILTSNLSLDEIGRDYGWRVKSRLEAKENIVVDMFECPDLRQEGL